MWPGRASSTCACRPPGTPRRCARAREPGFGGGTAAAPLKVNVEYVSANPTGALPVSAGRNAAYGDSLARVFAFAGHEVTREYYFNDSGAQIERFGLSLRARARGEPVPEDGYQGENLIALAEQTGLPPDASAEEFGRAGVTLMFAAIRATLERFRVHMDVFTNEVDLHRSGGVERALARADAGGHVFEAEGASWLRASEFGDDKDRVLIKADGVAHVLRRRPRLSRGQAGARVRPGDLRARRRPSRLLRAAESRRAGARIRLRSASRSRCTRWCI